MNTNRIARDKESNLSATTSEKKNNSRSDNHTGNSGQNKSSASKNSACNSTHECAGGICSTTWKPVQNLA